MQSNALTLMLEVHREEQKWIFTAQGLLWAFFYHPGATSPKSIWANISIGPGINVIQLVHFVSHYIQFYVQREKD